MAFPPYPGQGTRLPDTTSFDGEWLIEGDVFIFRAVPPGSKGEFAGIKRPDGNECDGFDADLLAGHLGVTADELFEMNRRKLLIVELRSITPGKGADSTIEYKIHTPDTGVRIKVSRAEVKGRA